MTMMTTMSGRLVAETRTTIHPCTIIRIPDPDESATFICGCYELEETTQQRKGSIVFGQIQENHEIVLLEEYSTSSGVLDIISKEDKLFLALSDSKLEIWQRNKFSISPLSSECKESEGLFLSVNSNHHQENSEENKIVISAQNGSVIVYKVDENFGLVEEAFLEGAHQLFKENIPAYIANINPYDSNCIVSGGDDMQFKIWDIRSYQRPQLVSKFHQAGVTSLEWFPNENNHLFISGSYDEICAFWDFRHMKNPLFEVPTGGGAWRLKWMNPTDSIENQFISIANMQNGSTILHLNLSSMELIDQYRYSDGSEKQLNYGLETMQCTRNNHHQMEFQMISCSFYDNIISSWISSFPTM